MKILHILSSADPKSGGPIEGVRQLTQEGNTRGWQNTLVTLDNPAVLQEISFPATIHALGSAELGNYGYSPKLVPWLLANAQQYDVVVAHGLWQYQGYATRKAMQKLNKPYWVQTHGMLDPWFKHAYPLKHLKKWLYWPWADYRVLRDAQAVLFTCEEEKRLASQSFWLYQANAEVIKYGTSTPPTTVEIFKQRFFNRYPHLQNKRIILFLSRIQEKKGCDILIEAFAKVVAQQPDLHLVMAGPDQTSWQATLQALATKLNVADKITWTGMVSGDDKWAAYYASEAFILPSHQENFGIVVAEALGCGVPVLISNKINIWREIAQSHAGFVNEDTVDGTVSNLQQWLALDEQQRKAMSQRAKACFQQYYAMPAVADSFENVVNKYRS